MTEKRSNKPKQREQSWYDKVNGAKSGQFVRYSLTPDEKSAMKAWSVEHQGDYVDIVEKILEAGYNLSLKLDPKTGAVSCFFIPSDAKGDNGGWILSSRASSACGAVLAAAYRHYVLFEEDWPKDAPALFELDDA